MTAETTREQVTAQVVGREREIELLLVAVEAGRDLVVEGPPGTSKTTLLKAITDAWGIPLILVEGNAELTPVGCSGTTTRPACSPTATAPTPSNRVPWSRRWNSGGFLYLEEMNRAPEDTLNVLLSAIADRRIAIPRVGTIEALPSFRLIGSMNPFDNVGTTRLSVSIKDRLNRLTIGYQDAAAEGEIVRRRSRRAVRRAISTRGSSPTRWPSPVRPGPTTASARDPASAARSTSP